MNSLNSVRVIAVLSTHCKSHINIISSICILILFTLHCYLIVVLLNKSELFTFIKATVQM